MVVEATRGWKGDLRSLGGQVDPSLLDLFDDAVTAGLEFALN